MGASTRPGAPEDYRLAMTSPVDEYIDATTGEARAKLTQLRDLIRALAPEASEKLAWGMPTWYLNGNLVHIAAFAAHVSLFPGGVVEQFLDHPDMAGRKHGKGTIQFPFGEELPVRLVTDVVTLRLAQQRTKKPRR